MCMCVCVPSLIYIYISLTYLLFYSRSLATSPSLVSPPTTATAVALTPLSTTKTLKHSNSFRVRNEHTHEDETNHVNHYTVINNNSSNTGAKILHKNNISMKDLLEVKHEKNKRQNTIKIQIPDFLNNTTDPVELYDNNHVKDNFTSNGKLSSNAFSEAIESEVLPSPARNIMHFETTPGMLYRLFFSICLCKK